MSTVLTTAQRPIEVFDVRNRKHRSLFAEYARTGSWKHSPVRFIASESTEVDVGTITRQMVQFYTAREFGKIST